MVLLNPAGHKAATVRRRHTDVRGGARHVAKAWTLLVTQDVSGAFRPNVLTALVGASGAGKVRCELGPAV